MHPSLKKVLTRWKEDGHLSLLTNLLFDAVILGWLAFFGFYSIEVLLPTFVTARFSLVKLFIVLAALTTLLAFLASELETTKRKTPVSGRLFLGIIALWALVLVGLSLYRFPWWTIPLLLIGYSLAAYLFWKLAERE